MQAIDAITKADKVSYPIYDTNYYAFLTAIK